MGNSERWSAALDQANQNRDYRQDQQNMNESTEGVGTNHSQEPEDQQQHCDSPEHWRPFPEAGVGASELLWSLCGTRALEYPVKSLAERLSSSTFFLMTEQIFNRSGRFRCARRRG